MKPTDRSGKLATATAHPQPRDPSATAHRIEAPLDWANGRIRMRPEQPPRAKVWLQR